MSEKEKDKKQTAKTESKVLVKQTRSCIGREKSQLITLRALGLGRIGQSQHHTLSPMVRGMINKVAHLVEISQTK